MTRQKKQKYLCLLTVPLLLIFTTHTHALNVNYGEALQKSIYFYEAQQSGQLPAWNRVPWRGDSTINDGANVGVDLSGGWYDAGDHVKFGLPMATAATLLAWGAIESPDGYTQSGQMVHIKNNLRFIADYFVAAHPQPNVFYAQVGTGTDDHSWWGPAEVLELQNSAAANRPAYAVTTSCPGSDVAGETAAALAAISIVFKNDDPAYSATLETHARDLHNFAMSYRGKYSDCITDAQRFYNSWSGYHDELAWSSAWLYKATGEQAFLTDAETEYAYLGNEGSSNVKSYSWTHVWDNKAYGTYVLMAQLTDEAQYKADAERWLDYWTTGYNGYRVNYTSGGFAQADQWGATRYAANTSFLALVYSDYLNSVSPGNNRIQTYYDFAVGQMEYIMGDNPMGHAYQVGIDAYGPVNPHHRTSHGSWNNDISAPSDNRHLLIGALVGGPGNGDSYVDDRGDHVSNEVAVDYNAGFTSALARLYEDFGGSPIPESQFPPAEVQDDEFFVEARLKSTDDRHVEIAAFVFNHTAWPARVTDNLKLRYWVDLTDEIAAGYQPADVSVSLAYHEGATASQLQAWGNPVDHLYYVDLSLAGTDLYPGHWSSVRKEVQFQLSLPNHATAWDNSADPSWNGYSTSNATRTSHIAVYEDSQLVWGNEPTPGCGAGTGINCVPTAGDLTDETDFEVALAITLAGQDNDGTIVSYTVDQAPLHGSVSITNGQAVYTPDAGFFGFDTFTYIAVDNQGAQSLPASLSLTVHEPIIPTVTIHSPNSGSTHVVGRPVSVGFQRANAASVAVMADGIEVVDGLTGNTATIPAPDNTGSFTVQLVTQDNDGNTLAGADSITLHAISNTAPEADFYTSGDYMTLGFHGGISTDSDGHQLTYHWDFGDNQTATGQDVSHTYALAGSYTMTLTVDDGQDSDTFSKTLVISEPPAGQASCRIGKEDVWSTGVVLNDIYITNDGSTTADWEVVIPVSDVNYIEQSWGQGTLTLEGGFVVARGTSLAAGQQARVGFKARHNGNFSYEGCYDQATYVARANTASCTSQVTSEWHGGWNTNVTITNNSGTTLEGWQLFWEYGDHSTARSGWSATFNGLNTTTAGATPLVWNADITPGQSVTFGFTSDKATPGSAAPAVNISGHICQ